jgi:hypothetical protein
VSCSRETSGCKRCKAEDAECIYSRSGIIRRNRKRKHDTLGPTNPSPGSLKSGSVQSVFTNTHPTPKETSKPTRTESEIQPHLATDIEVTRFWIEGQGSDQQGSLGALSSLSEACAAVWHDASEMDSGQKTFFLFEDRAEEFVGGMSFPLPRLCLGY